MYCTQPTDYCTSVVVYLDETQRVVCFFVFFLFFLQGWRSSGDTSGIYVREPADENVERGDMRVCHKRGETVI